MRKYTVDSEERPRLDLFVIDKVPELSRSYIKKLSELKKVLVNDSPAKSSYKLRNGDKVSLDYDEEHTKIPSIELPIVYEDKDCLVIDKPTGILSHSKGKFNPEATVASFIQARSKHLGSDRDGIVHRLDRATSGVMIVAKTPAAQEILQKEFSSRRVEKTYIAIVNGHLKDKKAVIDMPIERNPKKPSTFRVGTNGKKAITDYEVIASNSDHDLVKLTPKTGRTHQLRVHLSKLGHPIVGDQLYGGEKADRLYLHSHKLRIRLPDGKNEEFISEIPDGFNKLIKRT